MTTFVLTLDLSDDKQPGNHRAQHLAVAEFLDQAKQAIGSSSDRNGSLTHANPEAVSKRIVGSWCFMSAANQSLKSAAARP